MDDKIKEITEKLYQEGVAKGEARAQEIIEEARKQADAMIQAAQEDASRIVTEARQQAENIRQAVEGEIKVAAAQAISTLKQQIVDALMFEAVDKPLTAALSDPSVIAGLLSILFQRWNVQAGKHPSLEVLLPESKREELESALRAALQQELARGMSLRFVRAIKAGFQIRPEGKSFKISLTDEDFKEFFTRYLRPKTREFLFGR